VILHRRQLRRRHVGVRAHSPAPVDQRDPHSGGPAEAGDEFRPGEGIGGKGGADEARLPFEAVPHVALEIAPQRSLRKDHQDQDGHQEHRDRPGHEAPREAHFTAPRKR
jgi:hypothetical protein